MACSRRKPPTTLRNFVLAGSTIREGTSITTGRVATPHPVT
ncbi:hypothetical protein FTUN_0533 [Frigoriglobus tundricola]|uniref:Uncharacterized protein n=1 Tax=Frigoriglobus tundricola TaxID=2774151 RepID=A0A6M5YIG4_9BACT|nr:hypothetical protein FTUN_0533 [Frigoriglobus tundricola]